MSSLFSDPPFPRGATLLQGEAIELDGAGSPIAGVEIVGSVKAFPDVTPGTGPASVRNSNRLVYCVAARYKGSTVTDATTVAGRIYAFDAASLTEFTSTATKTNVADGRLYGVLDEYLKGELRQNDIVWLVVKGPVAVAKETGAAFNSGLTAVVSNTAGQAAAVGTASAGTVVIGTSIQATAASGATSLRINLASDVI